MTKYSLKDLQAIHKNAFLTFRNNFPPNSREVVGNDWRIAVTPNQTLLVSNVSYKENGEWHDKEILTTL